MDSHDSESPPTFGWTAAVAISLLIVYAAGYFASVLPNVRLVGERASPYYTPSYKFGGEFSEAIFLPAFCLDFQVRRQHWATVMDTRHDPFLAIDIDPAATDFDTDIVYNVDRRTSVSVPGKNLLE